MSDRSVKAFHVGDLLSVSGGRLVSPDHIGGVYNVIDFVTGEAHMTHQLGRAMDVVKPWLLDQHPWLVDVVFDFEIPPEPAKGQAEAIVKAWLVKVTHQYGAVHDVKRMPLGMYVGREPIAELREMAPHAEIITVDLSSGDVA